jgi:hypothetical protein
MIYELMRSLWDGFSARTVSWFGRSGHAWGRFIPRIHYSALTQLLWPHLRINCNHQALRRATSPCALFGFRQRHGVNRKAGAWVQQVRVTNVLYLPVHHQARSARILSSFTMTCAHLCRPTFRVSRLTLGSATTNGQRHHHRDVAQSYVLEPPSLASANDFRKPRSLPICNVRLAVSAPSDISSHNAATVILINGDDM